MPLIEWTDDLDTGVRIIDNQHRRIVDYINRLYEVQQKQAGRQAVAEVMDDLIEYTVAHFSYEESLMAQSGYPMLIPHQKTHQLFIKRINLFAERHRSGEDIADELLGILRKWLINHIKSEDQDYVSIVLQNARIENHKTHNGLSGILKEFF